MSDQADNASPVLQQADNLMRRHRRVFVAGAEPAAANNQDMEDIPVLTEIVDGDILNQPTQPTQAAALPEAEVAARINAAVGASETELTQALDRWIETYLPQMLSRALDGVAEQLRSELATKLRAEMLNRTIFDSKGEPADKPTPPV